MSTAEVGQPSLVSQTPHQHLTADGMESSSFRPGSVSRHAIINLDDDSLPTDGHTSPHPNRGGQSSLMSMGQGPLTTRPSVAEDDSFSIEDTGGTRVYRPNSNGAQNRPIIVLDSDEEQGPTAESTSASYRHRRGDVPRSGGGASSSSYRIFSPPPPSLQHHPVPPVPHIPPIIAEPMPFALLPLPVNSNQPRTRLPFDEPARPVNNNNSSTTGNSVSNGIQLGGGLLYQRNIPGRGHGPRAQLRLPRPSERDDEFFDEAGEAGDADDIPALNNAARFFGRIFSSVLSRDDGRDGFSLQRIPVDYRTLEFGRPRTLIFGGLGPWGRRDAALGLGPDYNRRMTHPDRAGPGWTYDFGTEHEEGGSKVEGSEILVCAKCLDPLLANADGLVDVSEDERKSRRVWGLRCGHVLDGKCVGPLMSPDKEKELVDNDIDPVDNHKGKGTEERNLDPEHAGETEVDGSVIDVKGKGKALDVIIPPTPLLNDTATPSLPFPAADPVDTLPPEDISIRSRLRSRRSSGMSSSSAVNISSNRRSDRQPATPNTVNRGGSSSTRRGTKRKRATAPTTEVVEERYEWTCPVSGCGQVHVSVKVGGLWKTDSERGAVGIYV